ncbi:hypothetical protein [Paraburkholderia sp.]|uniref:hypothetical protein n=1 Tax=Paraburkholderia sp. TaxID=1926495 RepID=UPI003C707358
MEAIRNAVSKAGAHLFVNARCDAYLAKLVEDSKLTDESIARARMYLWGRRNGLHKTF